MRTKFGAPKHHPEERDDFPRKSTYYHYGSLYKDNNISYLMGRHDSFIVGFYDEKAYAMTGNLSAKNIEHIENKKNLKIGNCDTLLLRWKPPLLQHEDYKKTFFEVEVKVPYE